MTPADLLVEIGTEELPPKALRSLMEAFADNLERGLDEARLEHGAVRAFATPRRLAVVVEALAAAQPDRTTQQTGPPVSVAFDAGGKPTAAAEAFAKKCGVDVSSLGRTTTPKGDYLSVEVVDQGRPTAELVGGLIETALAALPIPRRMRWGAGDIEFVRPVQWVVLLHGSKVVPAEILGIAAGNQSQGHRFHAAGPVRIASAAKYEQTLEKKAHVIADFDRRRRLIVDGVGAKARQAGGEVVGGKRLYDEVTALVEWPVPMLGTFDAEYLELPRETVVSTLTGHQRYFPVENSAGELLPRFVFVANLDSRDPDQVRDGNERVIRPRLADAAFFWHSDRRRPLASRCDDLAAVVYQRGLGSLYDKAARVKSLAAGLATGIGAASDAVERAALLAKCDLLTGMVGEFPELQGIMGRYYAAADGERDAVATAIEEQYLPRFAGDALPASDAGRLLSVADRLDTLAGVFSLGKKPSGNRDPFGLRRAALGIIRILVECGLDIDLKASIASAVALQPGARSEPGSLADDLYGFITDRLRRYFLDRDASLTTETFDAVLARQPSSLVDFEQRLIAVQAFLALPEAASLAAANKRIGNILKKADGDGAASVSKKLLVEAAEQALHQALESAAARVSPLVAERRYTDALKALADLKQPVDRFFDDVMVMTEDRKQRANRLALLRELRALFLDIADVSRLALG